MIGLIILNIALISFFLFIPSRYLSSVVTFFSHLYRAVSLRYQVITGLHNPYQANALISSLHQLEHRLSSKRTGLSGELPRYKYYTDLVLQLAHFNREMGTPISKGLKEIRQGIQRDLQFERKLYQEFIGGIFQFILVAIVTWSFIALSSHMVEIQVPVGLKLTIATLQGLGAMGFVFILRWIKLRKFRGFDDFFSGIYNFLALHQVGISVQRSISESKIAMPLSLKIKRFKFIVTRIENSIRGLTQDGIGVNDEFSEILKDLWMILEEAFSSFQKSVAFAKFIVLALFYLPAYFLFLYSLFTGLML